MEINIFISVEEAWYWAQNGKTLYIVLKYGWFWGIMCEVIIKK